MGLVASDSWACEEDYRSGVILDLFQDFCGWGFVAKDVGLVHCYFKLLGRFPISLELLCKQVVWRLCRIFLIFGLYFGID